VELDPVVGRRSADQAHPVLVEKEQDSVTDDQAIRVAGDELLRFADLEVAEAVDAQVREQPEDVRPLDVQVGHVVRLVEQCGSLPPGTLLVPPIAVLGRDLGVDVGADLRIANQRYRISGGIEQFLEAPVGHLGTPR
jgi:hypothetical protein